MAIAALVRPRFGAVAALLGLTLLGGHEPARPAPRQIREVPTITLASVIVPAPIADSAWWPRGMVMAPPETGDRIAFGQAPVAVVDLLSGLFDLLGSRGA